MEFNGPTTWPPQWCRHHPRALHPTHGRLCRRVAAPATAQSCRQTGRRLARRLLRCSQRLAIRRSASPQLSAIADLMNINAGRFSPHVLAGELCAQCVRVRACVRSRSPKCLDV
eukprot:352673-Chlamydomonas_euryale.AAC.6